MRLRFALFVLLMALSGPAADARAQSVEYSATQTIPVPPASNFAGQGGGDGWAIALSDTQVFNVFHHNGTLVVACHQQSDASDCYPARTIMDGTANFATNGHPEMHLDQSTGKLYVYATNSSTGTAGVVCADTTQAATVANPFCGFTPLTAAGEGPITQSGTSGVSLGMLVGNRWYAFNYVSGANASGDRNKVLCFDVSTLAPCAGQPYALDFGSGNVSTGGFPEPATAAIGTRLIIPVNAGGMDRLACFDTQTRASCGGSFPVDTGLSYAGANGSPFPMVESSGGITGFCLPTDGIPCFALDGASVATPPGLASVVEPNTPWNGPAFVLGPRVYVPVGGSDTVRCYSFATNASCPDFPKSFSGLGYLYTVNPDPRRPTCIWVNADNGSAQIQSFDAFTGAACGSGATRVLASQFVVPQRKCEPATYTSLQVLTPAPGQYSSGSIRFADGDGNPIPGAADRTLDANGLVRLSDLQLNTATGLPQFLITLDGASGSVSEVVVKLTWTGVNDPDCVGAGTTVSQIAPTAAPSTAPSQSAPPRRCTSRRRFRIRIVSHKADPVRSATVTAGGRRLKVTPRRIDGRRRLTAVVDLRGIERSTYTVRIRAKLRSGRTRTGKRTYNTCRARLVGSRPKL